MCLPRVFAVGMLATRLRRFQAARRTAKVFALGALAFRLRVRAFPPTCNCRPRVCGVCFSPRSLVHTCLDGVTPQQRAAAHRRAKVLALGLAAHAMRERAGRHRRACVFALGVWPRLMVEYQMLFRAASGMKFLNKRRRPSKTTTRKKLVAGASHVRRCIVAWPAWACMAGLTGGAGWPHWSSRRDDAAQASGARLPRPL